MKTHWRWFDDPTNSKAPSILKAVILEDDFAMYRLKARATMFNCVVWGFIAGAVLSVIVRFIR